VKFKTSWVHTIPIMSYAVLRGVWGGARSLIFSGREGAEGSTLTEGIGAGVAWDGEVVVEPGGRKKGRTLLRRIRPRD